MRVDESKRNLCQQLFRTEVSPSPVLPTNGCNHHQRTTHRPYIDDEHVLRTCERLLLLDCCLVFYIGSPMRCTTLSNPQASPTSWLTTTIIHLGDSLFLSSNRASSHPLDHLPPLQDMLCTQMASSIIPHVTLSPTHQSTTTRIRSPITLHRRTLILINNIY
jgi:hypothetical protein